MTLTRRALLPQLEEYPSGDSVSDLIYPDHASDTGEKSTRLRHIYRAGEWVNAGLYENIETRQLVRLERKDTLPPSFDGRVACYTPVEYWSTIMRRSQTR